MIIRKFEMEDLSQTLNLCNESREYHREILNGYFAPLDYGFEKEVFAEVAENKGLSAWVADDDGELCGFLLAKEKTAAYLEKPKIVNVENIIVKENYRHKSIGKKLMNALYQYCQGKQISEIKLGVFCQNKDAFEFYTKYGFELLEMRMRLEVK